MAQTLTLGKVSISPRGAYSSATSYTFLDVVSHNGGGFLCLQNAAGVTPGVTSGWQTYWMSVSKGIKTVSITSQVAGQAIITVTLSDGTQQSNTINTAAIGAGEVGTTELADGSVTAAKLAADAKSKGVAVTLTVAGWSSLTQTVNVSGVTADNNVIVASAPASRTAWNDAEVYCSAQAAGKLTFKCSTTPTAAVTANVVILV